MALKISIALAVVAVLPIVVFALLSALSRKPSNLGVVAGRLAACPNTPNCVSTQADDEQHRMAPIPLVGDARAARSRLRAIIESQPGATLVTEQDDYLHAEFRSKLFRFVDDVEAWIDEPSRLIHFRSASRAGRSDFGVNRRRMMHLRTQFKQAE